MFRNLPLAPILLILSGVLVLIFTFYHLYTKKLLKWIFLLSMGIISILGGVTSLRGSFVTLGQLSSYSQQELFNYCSKKMHKTSMPVWKPHLPSQKQK